MSAVVDYGRAIMIGANVKLLQIPVKASVAEQISQYASRVSKTQAQFAAICLECAAANRDDFADRMGRRLINAIGSVVGGTRRLRANVRTDNKSVRLQVRVAPELCTKLERIGSAMNHTIVQTAGWLIEQIVVEQDWLVRAVLSPMILEPARWLQELEGSSEVTA
jgi:hypothetical protein